MKIKFRDGLLNEVTNDLSRPHPFAFERVGYLLGENRNGILILNEWISFDDSHYEENEDVGARVGADGMTLLIKKAFSEKKLFFHTHLHDFQDIPSFSGVDMRSLMEVTPSLFDFSGTGPHGALLIGRKSSRIIWWDEKKCLKRNEQIFDYGVGPGSIYESKK